MNALGIFCGLAAAFSQSVYYLMSRHYNSQPGRGSVMLLAVSHLWVALFSAILLPLFLWGHTAELPSFSVYGVTLFRATGFYLLGHASLFAALRHTEASRVSPMLGLKVLLLALIGVIFQHKALSPLAWSGIGLAVAAAFLLNYSGASLPPRVVALALGACLGYSLSDLGIGELNHHLAALGWRTPFVACFMCFVLAGGIGLLLPLKGMRPDRAAWSDAAPVGAAWLVAMLFLFSTFQLTDVVTGNILQSTRGIQSIVLGVLVAHLGWAHLEVKVVGHVFARRFIAGVMMVLALVLYIRGGAPAKVAHLPDEPPTVLDHAADAAIEAVPDVGGVATP